ncbi:cytochrome c oxidase subunit 4 [Streptomyces cinnamoneus]|uniref:cytochrome-c oxidase n=1 Tax=Streptomyces cinnamoneus TaxID=53446 RepID=A0A918WPC1_STRCJ|nr:cytochrome c oxidase subunit 4 [Streptomyces cinnamoneus]GHC67889.1 cytochrome c oxidase polypeptide 4 [Streptomyces cinnamoneus]
MKTEAWLFGGVAGFFLLTDAGYAWWSGREPAGTTALAVSFLMASVVSFFFTVNYRRRGLRPEDRKDSAIADRAGRLDFFPPHSAYPALTALGVALLAVGVVYGLWLFIMAVGILGAGVTGMVFEFVDRE